MARNRHFRTEKTLLPLIIIFVESCCFSDKDWSRGCFNLSTNTHFRVSAGNYRHSVNFTAPACVRACSSLKAGYTQAGLAANGICLCNSIALNLSKNVSNIFCKFPTDTALYIQVYPIMSLPNITVPDNVFAFEEFELDIVPRPGPAYCSYVINMDDGRQAIMNHSAGSIAHTYTTSGVFTVKVTADPWCLPESIETKIEVKLRPGSPVLKERTLVCPPVIERTETNRYCQVQVFYGTSVLNVNYESRSVGNLSDTTVQTIGLSSSLFNNAEKHHFNKDGTYIIPQLTRHGGWVKAFQFFAEKAGNIVFQVFSTRCPSGKVFCFGECVDVNTMCRGSTFPPSFPKILPEIISLLHSFDPVSATVGDNFHHLLNPVFLPENSVLGFRSNLSTAILHYTNLSTPILFYPNQTFLSNPTIPPHNLTMTPFLRIHLFTMTSLLVQLDPVLPSIAVDVTLESASWDSFDASATVLVQERISGLKLLSPKFSHYYAVRSLVEFTFNVTNGTSVEYSVSYGDGNTFNLTDNSTSHSYQQKGNTTVTVTASNAINSVNISGTIFLVEDIRVSFVSDFVVPGEVGVLYPVKFQVTGGNGVYAILVSAGNNTNLYMGTYCENSAPVQSANLNFSRPGQYNITVKAMSQNLRTEITSVIDIQERLANITLEQLKDHTFTSLNAGDTVYLFLWENLTLRANISTGSPVTYIFNATGASHNLGTSLSSSSENPANFVFHSVGRRKITATAYNALNQLNLSITVVVRSPCESAIVLYDKRAENDSLQATRVSNLVFNLEIARELNVRADRCEKPADSCWNVTWTLWRQINQSYDKYPVESEQGGLSFRTPVATLPAGKYKLTSSGLCNHPLQYEKNIVQTTYFVILAKAPVAVIEGGQRRDVEYNIGGNLMLDASSSYDQNDQHFNSTGLKFRWSSNKTELGTGNEALFRVNLSDVMLGERVLFKVNVTSGASQAAEAQQLIYFVEIGVPTTEIICKVNCLPVVVITERLSLQGLCKTCFHDDNLNFTWTLSEINTSGNYYKVVELPSHNTSTGLGKRNIVIKPNVLEHDTEYQLELRAQAPNGKKSSSIYQFKTSQKPRDGTCVIKPLTGVAAKTNFRVECKDWVTAHFPLTYSIRYQSSFTVETKVSSLEGDSDHVSVLWYHGLEQISPVSTLPSGEQRSDYNLSVTVQVMEQFGSFAVVSLTVQVKPQNFSENVISEVIEPTLRGVDAEECPQKYTQMVTSFSKIFNANNMKDQDTKELRRGIVLNLTKIQAISLPLIKQTADAMQLTTYDSTEVTHETQGIASKALKTMSSYLVDIARNPSQRNGQIIDETARVLLSALSNVLNAALYTGRQIMTLDALSEVQTNIYGTQSNEGQLLEKIADETGDVVSKIDEVVHDISFAILKKKLLGEEPTTTWTHNFGMSLENERAWHAGSRQRRRLGDFVLPLNVSFASKPGKEIYRQMINFTKNPYTSDIGKSHFIQPNVRSLSFIDVQGKTIEERNLTKDIEIFLPNDKHTVQYIHFTPSKNDSNVLAHTFIVAEPNFEETIVLNFRASNASRGNLDVMLLVRYGSRVTQSDFEFSHWLNSSCNNCEGRSFDVVNGSLFLRDHEMLKAARGIVSIGILLPAMERRRRDSSANYTVCGRTVACKFWDAEWSGNGCKVGPRTTPMVTHCLCNHLTSFGSYIVKPNPLSKLSLDDFKQGYVTFIAVLVIFLLYLPAFIWARKADQHGFSTCTVAPLADNKPRENHRYEVAVWTGMRRNAGTRSQVNIVLYGDHHDSGPRLLSNPQSTGFQRGSLEKFLLTTLNGLGDLYCIRIWHDNEAGSWFLSRVMVTDLRSQERYYFICDRWLAVDEDDGQVERLIPVASEDELTEFRHLFMSRTKQSLSDSHLWLSVLNRPPQSPFTRVQRLSCCLCILMMTMAANAMFYQARSEPKPTSTNFIGSYSFTWDELFIAIQSTLLVFPATLIIMSLFRRIRSKPAPTPPTITINTPSSDTFSMCSMATLETSCDSPPAENKDQKDATLLNNNRKQSEKTLSHLPRVPTSLPRVFLYLAWLLLVVLTLGSASIVILYGMEFGNGRSLQWLLSIFLSILEDIFLMQPLKVFILALIFALVIQKPHQGEFQVHNNDGMARLHDNDDDDDLTIVSEESSTEREQHVTTSLPACPPDKASLKKARRQRLKERKIMSLINEIILHLLFTMVIGLIVYGHKDSSSYTLHHHLEGLETNSSQIHDIAGWWSWTRDILIPTILPEKLYNMADVPSYGFLDDQYNNLLSSARLRLLRMKEEACVIPDKYRHGLKLCTHDYSMFDQDEQCYDHSWTPRTTKHVPPIPTSRQEAWCFENWRTLDGYPIWGHFTTYSGSGYVTELVPGGNNTETMRQTQHWLNKQTRAIIVELTTYNANVNQFSATTILFEFPSYGGVFLLTNIQPMRLYVYVGGFAFFVFACEIVFVLFILMYSYNVLKKLYHQRRKYFKQFWNLIDFAILAVSLTAIVIYVYRIHLVEALMKRVAQRDGSFINFQNITYFNEVFNCVIALVITMTTIKLTKLMRFNLRISLFGKTLQRSRPALIAYSLQFGIVVFAFVMLGTLAFGRNVDGYKNIPSTILSLGRVILGKNEFIELPSIDPILGPLFFFTYILLVCWVLISMFMTILIDSYHQVKAECRILDNDYEVLDFIMNRFRAWSGWGRKTVIYVSPMQRWKNANLRLQAVKKFDTRPRYIPSNEDVMLEKTSEVMEKFEESMRRLEMRVAAL